MIRHLRLEVLTTTEFEIAEFQVFAQGFVPEARFSCPTCFDFGSPRPAREHSAGSRNSRAIRSCRRCRFEPRTGIDPDTVVFPRVGLQPSGTNRAAAPGGRFSGGGHPHRSAVEKRLMPWRIRISRRSSKTVLENPDLGRPRRAPALQRAAPRTARGSRDRPDLLQTGWTSRSKSDLKEDVTNWSPWSAPYSPAGIADAATVAEAGIGTGDRLAGSEAVFPGHGGLRQRIVRCGDRARRAQLRTCRPPPLPIH